MKKTSLINLTQAQQIERYRFPLIPISAKVNWIIIGFLFGTFIGWTGAWFMISCING